MGGLGLLFDRYLYIWVERIKNAMVKDSSLEA